MKRKVVVVACMFFVLMFVFADMCMARYFVISTWGGRFTEAQQEAFFKPFTEKTGIEIKVTKASGELAAKVKAQALQNRADIDLVCGMSDVEAEQLKVGGYIIPFDYSKIPNAVNVIEEAKSEYLIGAYVLSTNICFNKKFFPNGGPQNLKEFFDTKKFPGPRGLKGYSAFSTLEAGLLADGVAMSDLYPLDLDRAYDKLDQIKPAVSLFFNTGAQQTQALIDKEVYAGYFWVGRALAAAGKPGVELEVVFQDGALNMDYWVIPKTCRDKEAVHQFMNFVLDAKQEVIFTKQMKYGPVNPKTVALLPEDMQKLMATHPDNLKKQFWLNGDYWRPKYKMLNEQYTTWVSTKQ